jgi:flagellar biosynthetic protein FliP
MTATTAPSNWFTILLEQDWLDSLTPELRVLLGISSLTFIPLVVISMTAFTRIIIVLSLVRQALGLQQTPPNSILIALALFLTIYAMTPVIGEIQATALAPYFAGDILFGEALHSAIEPLKSFMLSQTDEAHFLRIVEMSGSAIPTNTAEISFFHLIPSFMLSELTLAFQMAFLIFLPFLLIDLLVASSLMALGMIMVPPITVSLPLKIMVFVLIDGWTLIASSLIQSFH